MPPVLGWCAVTGEISADALLLFLIIFAWTPPHFWALALYRRHDYARAGVPMLPITHGDRFTRLHVLLYTLILSATSLLPFASGMSGTIYLVSALALTACSLRTQSSFVPTTATGWRGAPFAIRSSICPASRRAADRSLLAHRMRSQLCEGAQPCTRRSLSGHPRCASHVKRRRSIVHSIHGINYRVSASVALCPTKRIERPMFIRILDVYQVARCALAVGAAAVAVSGCNSAAGPQSPPRPRCP